MSFDLGNIVGSIAKAVLPMAIDAICPEAALIPGLNNMVANLAGDLLSQGIDSIMQQSGSPQFMINDALSLIGKAVQTLQQPCDGNATDQAQNQYGGQVQNTVSDFIGDLLNKLRGELGCHGGKGGAGGSTPTGGPVTLRDLAAALGKLEEDEAKRLKGKVDDATKALGTAPSNGQAQSSDQFSKMEDVKAEAQIQSTLSSMVAEVIKNFGQAMQAGARE